jgi:hypothetical protein
MGSSSNRWKRLTCGLTKLRPPARRHRTGMTTPMYLTPARKGNSSNQHLIFLWLDRADFQPLAILAPGRFSLLAAHEIHTIAIERRRPSVPGPPLQPERVQRAAVSARGSRFTTTRTLGARPRGIRVRFRTIRLISAIRAFYHPLFHSRITRHPSNTLIPVHQPSKPRAPDDATVTVPPEA